MIVATAGHIDHGKTTLVRVLTGIDTDRLPEEKARGISIDLGFAHLTLPDGRTIGFVDVPGHERFIRNMLSGVYAVGHVMLVIAADDGVMPQTREHLHIVGLLGIRDATIVITKRDRVDASRLAQVEREALDLLRVSPFRDVVVLGVSAVTGEGVDALRERLARAAAAVRQADQQSGRLARYVVDRVFTVPGSGTIVTGTVIAGSIGSGDALVVSPAGTPARVRKLQRHGRATERAHAGERCAINVANIKHTQVARGDWLVAAEAHYPTDRMDVQVQVLGTELAPLKHWTPVHVHIGAADIPARVALQRGAAIPPGETALAQLRLERSLHAANGDRFILRDQTATRTLGGGVVIDPFGHVRRRALRPAVLAALQGRDVKTGLHSLLDSMTDGIHLDWLARTFNLPLSTLLEMVPSDAVVVHGNSHIAFSAQRVSQLQAMLCERVKRFHAEHSNLPGMEVAQLREELARTLPLDLFVGLAKSRAQHCGLLLSGSRLRLASHDSTNNPRDALAWQRVRPRLLDAGALIPSVRELAALSGTPMEQLRDLLQRKSALGEAVKLTHERFALPETMEMLGARALQTARGRPDGLFTAGQYRDVIGTGRGRAIEILECLDKRGVTQRRGDLRTVEG